MLVKPWLVGQETREIYNNLFRELRLEDKEEYKKFLKMDAEKFNGLSLRCVCFLKIQKQPPELFCKRRCSQKFRFQFRFCGLSASLFQSHIFLPDLGFVRPPPLLHLAAQLLINTNLLTLQNVSAFTRKNFLNFSLP